MNIQVLVNAECLYGVSSSARAGCLSISGLVARVSGWIAACLCPSLCPRVGKHAFKFNVAFSVSWIIIEVNLTIAPFLFSLFLCCARPLSIFNLLHSRFVFLSPHDLSDILTLGYLRNTIVGILHSRA